MDSDEVNTLNASIAWFDATAFDAECLPVESLDFGLLNGDVVPRDGIQRPLLTSGSPVHAPVPRRASKQPIHVTHVHQNVFQTFANDAPAGGATAAEGTSGLSQLERALHVPSGSIHPPAAKWKHRNKAMIAAGMPAHVHEGSIQCGSMLPPPLHHAASPLAPESEPVLMIEHVPHVSSVPLTPSPAHSSQHARDVIARITVQVIAPPPTIIHQRPQAQSERATTLGHAGDAIARMAAEATALAHVERGRVLSERDRCTATARLLHRAGKVDQADQVMAARLNGG
jgi:hypothetical protein